MEKTNEAIKMLRNAKDRERYATSEETREKTRYRTYKSNARNFLTKYIKDEDKEEFKKLLEEL